MSFFSKRNHFDVENAAKELGVWNPLASDVPRYYEAAKRSVDTVSHLTEYEDDKASRILTAMGFLTALVAAINAGFVQYVEVPIKSHPAFLVVAWTLAAFYFLSIAGSLVIVYAIFPRFNIKQRGGRPLSLIFAPEIERIDGVLWAQEFTKYTADQVSEKALKSEIIEAKLIAHKALRKIKWLKLGTRMFVCALLSATVGCAAGIQLYYAHQMHESLPKLIAIDADNTLWDTDAVYRSAQLTLLTRLESYSKRPIDGDRLAFVREVDQALAAASPLRFRYPAHDLARALLQKMSGGTAEHSDIPPQAEGWISEYEESTRTNPKLFTGTEACLRTIASRGHRIVIVTEESEELTRKRIVEYRLDPYVSGVVSGTKTPELYVRIVREFGEGLSPTRFAIGDQLERDVEPAKRSGYVTIYKPSAFVPKNEARGDATKADATAILMSELPEMIEMLASKAAGGGE